MTDGEPLNFDTEIAEWAEIRHLDLPSTRPNRPHAGRYHAYDRATGEPVGELSYYHLDETTLQLKDINVEEGYRRRKVAKALLRAMHLHHPHHRINPGIRTVAGQAFMDHVLATEPDLVATNGVLNVPLKTQVPECFREGWRMICAAQARQEERDR